MLYRLIFTFLISLGFLTITFAQVEGYGISFKVLGPINLEDRPLSDLTNAEDYTIGAQVGFRKGIKNWLTLEVPFRVGHVGIRNGVGDALSLIHI